MSIFKKRKIYFPSAFGIIFALMILFIVISWIGQAISSNITGVGILDIFTATWKGFTSKVDVILFIFSIGGTLGVLTKLRIIDSGIDALINKLGDKVFFLIPILMLIFGLGGSTYGMWEETIAFIPVLIPVFRKAGYGPFTAILVILVGAGTGCIASTINPFAIGVAVQPIKDQGINFSAGTMQGIRWISFLAFELVAIPAVMWTAHRYKSGKQVIKGLKTELIKKRFKESKSAKFTIRRKIGLSLFILTFICMIIFYLPWTNWMPGINDKGTSFWSTWLFWFASTSKSGFANLGDWYFTSVAALFLLSTILIFALNIKEFKSEEENPEEGLISSYMSGVKDVVPVCLLIGVAAGLGIILSATGIGPLIAKKMATGFGGNFILFGIIIFIVSLILSFFVPSSSGFASAFMPIFAGIAANGFKSGADQTTAAGLALLAFVFANGIANFITPTSAALMGYTSYAGVPYTTWVKEVWKIIITYFILGLGLMLIFGIIAQNGGTLF